MASVRRPLELSAPAPSRTVKEEPSAPLPFLELPYFNGRGGFTPDGREYAVYLGPGGTTPAPWVNVMANPQFGALVSESGSGFAWYGNSQRNRLTEWSNDPVCDPPAEAIYLRDLESGAVWTPTALPIREQDAYRARHGAGYTVFEHNSHAIEQELITFVPLDESGGDPLRVQRLRLRNDSTRARRLSVTFYLEWALGEDRERSQQHVVSQWDEEVRALLAYNRYHPEYAGRVAFATLNPLPGEFTADRQEFLGRNQSPAAPAAMKRAHLLGRSGAGLDPCAALQVELAIPPGQTREVICLLGQADSAEEATRLIARYRREGEVEDALGRTREAWDHLLGGVQVEVPDLALNFLLNRWLPYQNLSSRVWGRTGVYQPGGAFGFRDQLQDVLALVYSAPGLARQHILTAAARQFVEGDVQHWWHPPGGAGVRTRISDDMLWLPYAVADYVRVTGDVGLLDVQVPFLLSPPLGEELEAFQTPQPSVETASVFEHCRRAIGRGLTAGPHGLPLMGTGDWNDGMNRVGVEGRGESVWLGWFLVEVLGDFADVAETIGRAEDAAAWRAARLRLTEALEREAWDGAWYRRAYFDDGTALGSASGEDARIDSLPQSWAVLSGAADSARARQALESASEHLVREDQNLILLLTPPFDRTAQDPGYIRGYPPGVRENGGQYTHAAVWQAIAWARLGEGDRAVRLLRMLSPVEHTRDPQAVERYRVEPYAVASDVYALPGREGQGGWTWYTGSAAWLYRAWIEEILGLKVRGDRLGMDPVLPADWRGFRLRYRHGQAVYEITVENPEGAERGVARLALDGQTMPDLTIPLESAPFKHRVHVLLGQPAPPGT
jgi:cyclic beta-1,2-glucan synthetase